MIIHGLLLQFMNDSGSFVSPHFAHCLLEYFLRCKSMTRKMKEVKYLDKIIDEGEKMEVMVKKEDKDFRI